MNPLSPLKYILNNRSSLSPLYLCIFLAVFLVYFISILGRFLDTSIGMLAISPHQHFSCVQPLEPGTLDSEIIRQIQKHPSVQNVLPSRLEFDDMAWLFGTNPVSIYLVQKNTIPFILEELDLTLIEGNLPTEGRPEVLIHQRFAKNKGLQIGDQITNNVFHPSAEKSNYTVSGILDGSSVLSFALLDRPKVPDEPLYKNGLLVFPKPDQLEDLNTFLFQLPPDKVTLYTIERGKYDAMQVVGTYNRVKYALITVLILVLCILLNNINYINYYHRKREFALLFALGYTKKRIILRYLLENLYLNLLGFSSGILSCMGATFVFSLLILVPIGYEISVWSLLDILITLSIPVIVTLSSVFPAIWLLNKLVPRNAISV